MDKLFFEVYKELDEELRRECEELVRDGKLTPEQAEFRYYMVRDEQLESLMEMI